jgi:hypothetical protein
VAYNSGIHFRAPNFLRNIISWETVAYTLEQWHTPTFIFEKNVSLNPGMKTVAVKLQ